MNGVQENLKLEFVPNAKVPIGIDKEDEKNSTNSK